MIYTFITDSEKIENFAEKRDCHSWQPLTLIPEKILSEAEETKNSALRYERLAAYSLLCFASLSFFGTKIKDILRNEHGKPYASELDDDRKIYFSISHSDGLCAVMLSDEGECGVDIQALPSQKQRERVEKRFLSAISEDLVSENDDKKSNLGESQLIFAEPSEEGFTFLHEIGDFSSVTNEEEDLFLKKWTSFEAILKCFGNGFSDASRVNLLSEGCVVSNKQFSYKYKRFGLAICRLKNSKAN